MLRSYACFDKLWVGFMDVPLLGVLPSGVYIGAPDFWKLRDRDLEPGQGEGATRA